MMGCPPLAMRLALAGALLSPHGTQAQGTPSALKTSDFAFGYDLPTEGGAPHEVELPPAVYSALTRSDRRDLCVFDEHGQVVPFVLFHPPGPEPELVSTSVPWFALPSRAATVEGDLSLYVRRDGRGTIAEVRAPGTEGNEQVGARAWLLDLTALSEPVVSLSPVWNETEQDFLATLEISASDDLSHWSHVVTSPVAQLRAAEQRLGLSAVALGGLRARYLRLTLQGDTPPDIVLSRLDVGAEHRSARPDAASVTVRSQGADRPLRFVFEVPGPFPEVDVRVTFAESNTLVEGVLEAAATRDGAFFERFRGPLSSVEGARPKPSIRLLDGDRWLRLTLSDKGSARTAQPSIALHYRPQHLQFLPHGPGVHVLAVGSVRRSADPVTGVLPVRAGVKHIAVRGARRELGGAAVLRPAPAPPPPVPWRAYGLWAVLVLATALFAWLAVRLMRDMNRGP